MEIDGKERERVREGEREIDRERATNLWFSQQIIRGMMYLSILENSLTVCG